jgi:hypothetical protein
VYDTVTVLKSTSVLKNYFNKNVQFVIISLISHLAFSNIPFGRVFFSGCLDLIVYYLDLDQALGYNKGIMKKLFSPLKSDDDRVAVH